MSETFRSRDPNSLSCRGKEVFEILPVILGGSPTDPANKVVLDRAEHMKAVVYWNRIIKEMREQRAKE